MEMTTPQENPVDIPVSDDGKSPSLIDQPALMWPFLFLCILMVLDSMVAHLDPLFERRRVLLSLFLIPLALALVYLVGRKFALRKVLSNLALALSSLALLYVLLMLCWADGADNVPKNVLLPLALLIYPGVAGLLVILTIAVPSLLGNFAQKSTREAWNALAIALAALLFLFVLFLMEGTGVISSPRMAMLLSCKGNLKAISSALDYYSSEHGGNYPPSLKELTPPYLEVMPVCPASADKAYHYEVNSTRSDYTLWCDGKYHRKLTGFPGYPQYSGSNGMYEHPSSYPKPED